MAKKEKLSKGEKRAVAEWMAYLVDKERKKPKSKRRSRAQLYAMAVSKVERTEALPEKAYKGKSL